ncbi:glycosyl transferase [Dichotomocladium elegans]|nr:glycosyl transferase [Dichotomocladium elegans]
MSSPVARWLAQADYPISWTIPLIILFTSWLVRWLLTVPLGFNTPPMYGDYEAQRHWMEITLHLPYSRWYNYDVEWWGLDYPPLTAFHSLLCGFMQVGTWFDPVWFALDASRGLESAESKMFMRATVLISEAIIYVPAAWCFCRIVYPEQRQKHTALFLILMQPALILIDHGHFQFNNVMLGFSLWTINGLITGHYILGSIAFCLSLGFKQMALYYALAVFAFLLGQCFKASTPTKGLILLLKLGITVVITLGTLFSPWLHALEQLQQVVHRIFPVARGLYEDKVANVWCALNVIVKLRNLLSLEATVRLSLCTTFMACLPVCIHLGMAPSPARFGYALLNTSLAFFLFSFQVHEKSILLPLLPATLMLQEEPVAVQVFNNVAMFSMFPLLKREHLTLAYVCVTVLWNWMTGLPSQGRYLSLVTLAGDPD